MKERIFGAVIVVAYALLMYLAPYNYYYALVYFLGALLISELFKMASLNELMPFGVFLFSLIFFLGVNLPFVLSILSTIFSSLSILFYSGTFLSYLLLITPLLSALSLLLLSLITYGRVKESLFPTLFFFVYSTFGLIALAKLTKPYFLLLLALVWSTDTFAYLTGRFFGKRRVVPTVSPKKTLEGFLGGSLLGTLLSYVVSVKLNLLEGGLQTLLFLFFLTGVSQLGDLLESSIKRLFKVKDSGSTIPGHGGVLDRLDSTLAAAPLLMIVGGLT
jgi:phosphatidate cytidylyltransferase